MLRRLALIALAACASPTAAQQAGRAGSAEIQVVAGAYELQNEAGTRKCVLLLRPPDAPGGQAIGFPPQCRSALPLLGRVAAWRVRLTHEAPRARISLHDGAGETILSFDQPGLEGAAQARDAAGQVFSLRPVQGATLAQRADSLVAARPAPPPVRSVPPPDPAEMRKVNGTYALIRRGDLDTGCRIALEPYAADAIEGKAVITGACNDRGIAFFGPRGWSANEGTLWLTGVRGKLSFERNRRGDWEKSPGQGEWLGLQRQ